MPRYEFTCESCKKSFEVTPTLAERANAKGPMPEMWKRERRNSKTPVATGGERTTTSISTRDSEGGRVRDARPEAGRHAQTDASARGLAKAEIERQAAAGVVALG